MNEPDPVIQYLSRPENLSIALDIERALKLWDAEPREIASKTVGEVLSNQENLVIARSIAQRVKMIKNSLLLDFGEELHSELGELQKEGNFSSQWKLEYEYSQEWTKPYAGSGLLPIRKAGSSDSPCLYIIIQRTNNFVNYGISRSEEKVKRPLYWELPEVKALESWLLEKDYSRHRWWLGYKHQFDLRKDKIYLGMAGRREDFVKEAVNMFWNLFERTQPMLEEANRAVAQMYLQQTANRKS